MSPIYQLVAVVISGQEAAIEHHARLSRAAAMAVAIAVAVQMAVAIRRYG